MLTPKERVAREHKISGLMTLYEACQKTDTNVDPVVIVIRDNLVAEIANEADKCGIGLEGLARRLEYRRSVQATIQSVRSVASQLLTFKAEEMQKKIEKSSWYQLWKLMKLARELTVVNPTKR